ncbi:hypothetical protein ACFWFK_04905 [Micromonospora chalcea]
MLDDDEQEASGRMIRQALLRADWAASHAGRLKILEEVLGVMKAIERWAAPREPDFVDVRYGTSLSHRHPLVTAVLDAGEELRRRCQDVGDHILGVDDDLVELDPDFDLMWMEVEQAVTDLQQATRARDHLHDQLREPCIELLSQADHQRLMSEMLSRAAASLAGEQYVPEIE